MAEDDNFLAHLDMALSTTNLHNDDPKSRPGETNNIFLFLSKLTDPGQLAVGLSRYDLSTLIEDVEQEDNKYPRGTTILMFLLHLQKEDLALELLKWVETNESLAASCLVGHQDSIGTTALMLAAKYGFIRVARMLMPHEKGKQTLLEPFIKHSGTRPSSWESGKTALMYAVEAGNLDIALLLAEHEAGLFATVKVQLRNTDRSKTVITRHHFALDILEQSAEKGDIGPNLKTLIDMLALDYWMRGALIGDLPLLEKMAGSFLGRRNGLGQTATMVACYKDQADSIRTLIRASPEHFALLEVGCCDIFNNSALCYSILLKAVSCLTLLSAYDQSFAHKVTRYDPDTRNIAPNWCGKGIKSPLEYAQYINLATAYPLLSAPLVVT